MGRIFGIDLRVDWSWVFIFVLLTWNLIAVFSRWHPDWAPLTVSVVAGVSSLVFFACVLLHELAHSAVALAYGVRVRSITLFMFGGVSNIERTPPSAFAEFLMALVGPMASLLLGGAALLATSVAMPQPMTDPDSAVRALSQLGPGMTMLAWLGPINVMIGLFNMVPGFPLDGGRMLRAVIWGVTGDLRAATRWAAGGGQVVGWLFIAVGIAMSFGTVVPFFGTGLAGGLWLAFIGWFLRGAATQAYTRLALDDAMTGISVAQLMQARGAIASPDDTIATVVHEHFVTGDDRALLVVEDGRLIGLIAVADARRVSPDQWERTTVRSVMRGLDGLLVAAPDEPLATAFEQLATHDIDQMPVVSRGVLVGVLRRRDIARWLELAWKPSVGGGHPTTIQHAGR